MALKTTHPEFHPARDPKGLASMFLQNYGYVLIDGLRTEPLLEELQGLAPGHGVEQSKGPFDVKQQAAYEHLDSRGVAFPARPSELP